MNATIRATRTSKPDLPTSDAAPVNEDGDGLMALPLGDGSPPEGFVPKGAVPAGREPRGLLPTEVV